ncbi:MAG: ankyrin repeat domain-containing protein [bacterium]|nr:ankyrin repeat domain-containing protein [bacterium]
MQAATSDHPLALDAWGAHWLEEIDRLTGEKKKAFVAASFKRAIEAIQKGMREKWETADAPETAWVARAQLLMARAHGFENWDVFTDLIAPAPGQSEEALAFESAVDAVVEGDLKVLQSLVGQFPALVETRSTRTHQAALLHYIAANGVEDFRQRTPGNAVEMAGYLLASGAEVDALANTYGGGKTQTPMNLLVSSAHPSAAGLMAPLVEVLLHFGAAIHGLENNGSPLRTALASGYLDGAEALVRGGARIDTLVAVASLGRLNLVDSFFSRADGVEQGRALVDASRFGQTEMVANLLDRGVAAGSVNRDDMSALHWAAAHCHGEIVRLLLNRRASLETKNKWGGTVLGFTVFSACTHPDADRDYVAMIETLLAAGARVVAAKYPTGLDRVDAVLRRYRESAP